MQDQMKSASFWRTKLTLPNSVRLLSPIFEGVSIEPKPQRLFTSVGVAAN